MKSLIIAVCAILLSVAAHGAAPKDETKGNPLNGGFDYSNVGEEDAVETVSQKVATFGKQTRVLQIAIPVQLAAKWRPYYIAKFVTKYASTLNRLIGDQMELCLSSDEPNEKGADAWEANEIVVPDAFENLPEAACPKASDLVNNRRIESWQYRSQKLAREDFDALKKKIGSAK